MRIRTDKIKRKPKKNNVVDLDIEQLTLKKDNTNYDYNSEKWIFNLKDSKNLYLNRLVTEELFSKKINIIKDFKHFLKLNKSILSTKTLSAYYNSLKSLLQYEKKSNFNISNFKDINYDFLLQYCNYLESINATMTYYDGIRALLKRLSKINEIQMDTNIKNNVFPTAKLKVVKNVIKPYSEEEFQYLAKFVTNSLNLYFENKKEFGYKNFCKCAYWYLSMLSGLNQTALNSLNDKSIEKIKDTNELNVYIVTGEKNRNKKGFQNSLFAIKKNNTLFKKVLNELKSNYKLLSKENNNIFLFSYKGLTGLNQYKGSGTDINKLFIFKEYVKKNKFNDTIPTLSTAKIRNFLSASVYHKTKDEQIVSTMLDHENLSMTTTHYIKHKISEKSILKFNTVQELMFRFSQNDNFEDWVEFQKSLKLNNTDLDIIINNLNNGLYSSQLGQCIKNKEEENNLCTSYINCFQCKHFSIIGERDAWKLISFKEALFDLKGNSEKYNWIYPLIDNILKSFDKDILINSKQLLMNKGRHPFWKNEILIKNITEQYEKENESIK